jgi:mannose-6-phosphate isomerase-like protein (cupin superfamily)
MDRPMTTVGLAAAFCLIGVIHATAQGQKPKMTTAIFVPSDKATFKEVVPGASKAVLWGSDTKGPYGAFTKFAPAFDAGTHFHTNDISIVVLKGAYLYKDEAGEKRVGPGDFIRVPGGHKHWSGGDAKEGALFYESSAGKFDLVPTK